MIQAPENDIGKNSYNYFKVASFTWLLINFVFVVPAGVCVSMWVHASGIK